MEVKVHEAKTHLSRLLQRVEAGEEITIARVSLLQRELDHLCRKPRKLRDFGRPAVT